MFVRKTNLLGKEFFYGRLEDKSICGKRGGANYLEAIQPDPVTGKCPGILIPCSDEISIENSYCRHPNQEKSEVCPITSISFERIGAIVDPTSIVLEWSNQLDLVFSRDNDARPISETRIEEL